MAMEVHLIAWGKMILKYDSKYNFLSYVHFRIFFFMFLSFFLNL